MSEPWPKNEIILALDGPPRRVREEDFRRVFKQVGIGESFTEFLLPLYRYAEGATFFNAAFRILPFSPLPEESLENVLIWNSRDLKQYMPPEAQQTFFFAHNAFGDLFGARLTEQDGKPRFVPGILWLEEFVYEESSLSWPDFLLNILQNKHGSADYMLKLADYKSAVAHLGKLQASECFAWNVPLRAGGKREIKNLRIAKNYVSVSFNLKILHQLEIKK